MEQKMKIEERVSRLVEEKIADRPDLFIVDVKMNPDGKLAIFMDGDRGISIEDCAAISRYVGYKLEENNEIDHAYNLEVSSPGIDTPLKLVRQYQKNINRNIKVKEINGTVHEGRLTGVSENEIVLVEKVRETKGPKKIQEVEQFIPYDQITETKVLISFK
jgi:ribosome maturation factor RimP